MNSENSVSGWTGWVYFAGVMMTILGFFQLIIGFITLFNNNYLIITPRNLLFLDLTTWAWIHLILGLIVLLAGFAVFSGRAWGRVIGVIIASISAITNLGFIPAYPIWSIIVITVDILVIYALIVHGHELKS